jgi:hypothetical protein
MGKPNREMLYVLLTILVVLIVAVLAAQENDVEVNIQWTKATIELKTTPTLQVVVNPLLRRDSAIHHRAFRVLRDLQADYVRYVPLRWL